VALDHRRTVAGHPLIDICNANSEEVHQLRRENPELPQVVGLMLGDEDTLTALVGRTEPNFPMTLIEPLTFFEFIGSTPPRIHYVHDGQSVHYWDEHLPEVNDLCTSSEHLAHVGA